MVGAAAVVVGLYVVRWGKAKDFDDNTKMPISIDEASKIHESNIKEPQLDSKANDETESV